MDITWKGSAWATDLSQVVSSDPDVTLHRHTPTLRSISARGRKRVRGNIRPAYSAFRWVCCVTLPEGRGTGMRPAPSVAIEGLVDMALSLLSQLIT